MEGYSEPVFHALCLTAAQHRLQSATSVADIDLFSCELAEFAAPGGRATKALCRALADLGYRWALSNALDRQTTVAALLEMTHEVDMTVTATADPPKGSDDEPPF